MESVLKVLCERKFAIITLTLASLILLTSMANTYATEEIPTFTAKVGELKKITFKLTIPTTTPKEFTYVIQVKDKEGFVQQLSLVQGVLQEGQEFRPQQSWVPENAGEYMVEIFVLPCIDCPFPLPTPLTMKVIVEE